MRKVRVFISYARADLDVAHRIVAALEDQGLACQLDQRDLPYAEKWKDELERMIRAADAVVFLASRSSVKSTWCNWELAKVAEYSKRLVPIRIEDVAPSSMPTSIQELQLLHMLRPDDLPSMLPLLLTCITVEHKWLLRHTQLTERAAHWYRERSRDQLLRGEELERANGWLRDRPVRAPAPGAEVGQYLAASALASRSRSRRQIVGALSVAVFAILLAAVAVYQRYLAEEQRRTAESSLWISQARQDQDRQPDQAIRSALRSWRQQPSRQNLGFIYQELAVRDRLISTLRGHTAAATALTLHMGRGWLVSAGEDGTARIWDLQTHAPLISVAASARPLSIARLTPDGATLVALDEAGFASIWNSLSGERIQLLQTGDAEMPTVNRERRVPNFQALHSVLSIDGAGKRMAVRSPDGIWLVELPTGRVIRKIGIKPPNSTLSHYSRPGFSPNGRLLVVTSIQGTRFFRAEDGSPIADPPDLATCGGCGVAFTPSGQWMMTSGSDVSRALFEVRGDTLTRQDPPVGESLLWIDRPERYIFRLAADRKTIVRSRLDLQGSLAVVGTLEARMVSFHPLEGAATQAAVVIAGNRAYWWRDKDGEGGHVFELGPRDPSGSTLFPASPDLVMSRSDKNVEQPRYFEGRIVGSVGKTEIRHSATNEGPDEIRQTNLPALTVAGGKVLATRNAEMGVRLWDIENHGHLARLVGPAGTILAWIANDSNGLIYAACEDGTIRVWNGRPSEPNLEIKNTPLRRSTIGTSSNARFAMAEDAAGISTVVDLRNGAVVSTLDQAGGPRNDAATISEDGQRAFTVSEVFTKDPSGYVETGRPFIRVWDITKPRARLIRVMGAPPDPSLSEEGRMRFAADGYRSLTLNLAGNRLASYRLDSASGEVSLWNVDNAELISSSSKDRGAGNLDWLRFNEVSSTLSFFESTSNPALDGRYVLWRMSDGKRMDLPAGSRFILEDVQSDRVLLEQGKALEVAELGALPNGRTVRIAHGIEIRSANAFGSRGTVLALGGESGKVEVHRTSDGQTLWKFEAVRPVRHLAFSLDGATLFVTTDATTKVMSVRDRVLLKELSYPLQLLDRREDDRVFLGGMGDHVSLLSMDSGEPMQIRFNRSMDHLYRGSLKLDGRIVLQSRDGDIQVWDCPACRSEQEVAVELARRISSPLAER